MKQNQDSSASGSSGSGENNRSTTSEQGDYIINWHLQYCASLFLQQETNLKQIEDLIKAEIMKIRTDGEFIKNQMPGPHNHLIKLEKEDKDLRSILDSISSFADACRSVANRSARRII